MSVPEKVKLRCGRLLRLGGPEPIEVCRRGGVDRPGGARGVASVFPACVDRPHFEVCEPSASPAYACGVVQAAKAAPSRRHWNDGDARAAGVGAGEGEAGRRSSLLRRGPESIEVVGRGGVDRPGRCRRGRVGVPGRSIARTSKLCEPSAERRNRPAGVVQAARRRRRRRHWKEATPEPPVSVPEKVKLAGGSCSGSAGPESIEVVGRGGVDRPGGARRGRVDVSGLVDRPHFEGMGAVGEPRIGLRAWCRRRRRPVAAALEGATPEPPVSVPEKVKLAEADRSEPAGRESIEVSGAWCRSSRCSLPGSRRCSRPGRSPALRRYASRRQAPSRSAGEVQVAQPRPAESRRHWKEATPEPPVSVPEKVKLRRAVCSRVGGPESIEVFGRGGVDRPGRAGGGRVGVPGLVDRPDFEAMRAVGERGIGLRGEVQPPQSAAWVESSRHWKEATPEPPVSVPEKAKLAEADSAQSRRARADRGGRGGGVDRPGGRGRSRVDVPGLVDRPHFEGMRAVGESGVGLRGGAGCEGGAVAAALEATPRPSRRCQPPRR